MQQKKITDEEKDKVYSALSFLENKTVGQLSKETGIPTTTISKFIKQLDARGEVIRDGHQIKYPNSED